MSNITTTRRKPTLSDDPRRKCVTNPTNALSVVTGCSSVITGTTPPATDPDELAAHPDRAVPRHWSRVDLYVASALSDHQHGHFDRYNNLPLMTNHSGRNGDGGVSDMTRVRLAAITDTYHKYHADAVAAGETGDTDVLGNPYDPEFDALALFLEGRIDEVVGIGILNVIYGPGSTPLPNRWPVRGECCANLYAQREKIKVPAGYVVHCPDGSAFRYTYPVLSDGTIDVLCEPHIYVQSVNTDDGTHRASLEEIASDRTAIVVDSCQQEGKHDVKHAAMEAMGYNLYEGYRLVVGDYMSPVSTASVDTKRNIAELATNLADDGRFERELRRAQALGIPLFILVDTSEEGITIRDSRDIPVVLRSWRHPLCRGCGQDCTAAGHCIARSGEMPIPLQGVDLMERLNEVALAYPGVRFEFVNGEEAQGHRVVGILAQHRGYPGDNYVLDAEV